MVFLLPENRSASHVSKQMTGHESRLVYIDIDILCGPAKKQVKIAKISPAAPFLTLFSYNFDMNYNVFGFE